jgi:hypothetical protein
MSSREIVFGNMFSASARSSSRVGMFGRRRFQSKSARCRNSKSVARTDDNSDSWTDDLIASAMCSGLKRPASCSAVRLTTRDPNPLLIAQNLIGWRF